MKYHGQKIIKLCFPCQSHHCSLIYFLPNHYNPFQSIIMDYFNFFFPKIVKLIKAVQYFHKFVVGFYLQRSINKILKEELLWLQNWLFCFQLFNFIIFLFNFFKFRQIFFNAFAIYVPHSLLLPHLTCGPLKVTNRSTPKFLPQLPNSLPLNSH